MITTSSPVKKMLHDNKTPHSASCQHEHDNLVYFGTSVWAHGLIHENFCDKNYQRFGTSTLENSYSCETVDRGALYLQ